MPAWLSRHDFRDGYVDIGTSITDGITARAAIDWLAASLADGIPADLRDAFTRVDTANVDRAVRARCSMPRDAVMARAERLLDVIRHEHLTALTVGNSCQQASPSRLSAMPTLTPGCSP
jgi:hypothetical protein